MCSGHAFVVAVSGLLPAIVLTPMVTSHLAPRDGAILALAGAHLGIPHPPGYPVYTLLAYLSTLAMPFSNPVYAMNLLSVLFVSIACMLLSRIILEISNSGTGALVGVVMWSSSPLVLFYGRTVEVFAMHSAIAAAVLLTLTLWLKRPENQKLLYLTAFFGGLGMVHHHTIALFVPAALAAIFLRQRRILFDIKFVFVLTACAVLPILFGGALLLFFARRNPWLNWGSPSDLEGLIRVMTRAEFGTFSLSAKNDGNPSLATLGFHFRSYGELLFSNLHLAGLLSGAVGIYDLFRKMPRAAIVLFLALIGSGPLFVYLYSGMEAEPDIAYATERFHLAHLMVFSVFAGIGAARLCNFLKFRWDAVRNKFALKAILIVGASILLLAAVFLFSFGNIRRELRWKIDESYTGYLNNLMSSLPKNAVFITADNSAAFGIWYLQQVTGKRKDVFVYFAHGYKSSEEAAWKKIRPLLDSRIPDWFSPWLNRVLKPTFPRNIDQIAQFSTPLAVLFGALFHRPVVALPGGHPEGFGNFVLSGGLVDRFMNEPVARRIPSLDYWEMNKTIRQNFTGDPKTAPPKDAPYPLHELVARYADAHKSALISAIALDDTEAVDRSVRSLAALGHSEDVKELLSDIERYDTVSRTAYAPAATVDQVLHAAAFAKSIHRWNDAEALYQKAAHMMPDHLSIRRALTGACIDTGNLTCAKEAYLRILHQQNVSSEWSTEAAGFLTAMERTR